MKITYDRAVGVKISLLASDLAVLKTNAIVNRRSLSAEIRLGLSQYLTALHRAHLEPPASEPTTGALAFDAVPAEQSTDTNPAAGAAGDAP